MFCIIFNVTQVLPIYFQVSFTQISISSLTKVVACIFTISDSLHEHMLCLFLFSQSRFSFSKSKFKNISKNMEKNIHFWSLIFLILVPHFLWQTKNNMNLTFLDTLSSIIWLSSLIEKVGKNAFMISNIFLLNSFEFSSNYLLNPNHNSYASWPLVPKSQLT